MKTLVVGNSLDVLPLLKESSSLTKMNRSLFLRRRCLPYDRSLLPAVVAATTKEESYINIEDFYRTSSGSSDD